MADDNTEIQIRPRTSEDLASCIEVLQRVYDKDGYPVQGTADALQFLNSDEVKHCWVATMQGRIIGHVAVTEATSANAAVAVWQKKFSDAHLAILARLFVDPSCRGRGVADKLIRAAVEWAEHANVQLVLLVLDKDQGAKGLYQKLGWSMFGTTTYHYGQGQQMAGFCFSSPPQTATK